MDSDQLKMGIGGNFNRMFALDTTKPVYKLSHGIGNCVRLGKLCFGAADENFGLSVNARPVVINSAKNNLVDIFNVLFSDELMSPACFCQLLNKLQGLGMVNSFELILQGFAADDGGDSPGQNFGSFNSG